MTVFVKKLKIYKAVKGIFNPKLEKNRKKHAKNSISPPIFAEQNDFLRKLKQSGKKLK